MNLFIVDSFDGVAWWAGMEWNESEVWFCCLWVGYGLRQQPMAPPNEDKPKQTNFTEMK